ncbi:MAG: 50S ribosomal protein L32, partial [Ruminococcus sp.]|nr:50S ribosomal protein L32 [Candidatus Apopatosoma intestinale]
MAVPKKKVSKARRDKRRSNVWKLELPGMSKCP